MANISNLRATALLTLLLITEAMYIPEIEDAKYDLKPMALDVLSDLGNSTCKRTLYTTIHTIGHLRELNNTSDCELTTTLSAYFTEASALDIHTDVTEKLQAVNQHLQHLQKVLCRSKPQVKIHGTAFKKSDEDHEKVCKVMSLLGLLLKWLSR